MLAEIGKRLGRKALAQVACVAEPVTILAWYRRLIASKFDGSERRRNPGRHRIAPELEALIVEMARENSGWGYDRIVGALANVGVLQKLDAAVVIAVRVAYDDVFDIRRIEPNLFRPSTMESCAA